MIISEDKEYWTTAKIIDEIVHNLCSIKDEDGFRKYQKYAKWYVHRVSVYYPPPSFDIKKEDLSTRVKKELVFYSKDKEYFKKILVEVVCRICELANTSDFNRVVERGKIIPKFI